MKKVGITVWYVIQVISGEEKRTIELCKALVEGFLFCDIFSPEIEMMKRQDGEWHKKRKKMFPGYVFVITNNIEELFLALNQVPRLTKILGSGYTPVPLTKDEIQMLQHVMNQDYLAEVSKGIMVGDRLVIESGPMMGLEGFVKKINRHKRTAVLEVEMFGQLVEVMLGLEVVRRYK